jgi:hypothetical protein
MPLLCARFTPVYLVAHFGRESVLRFLLEGEDSCFDDRIETGWTPLHDR